VYTRDKKTFKMLMPDVFGLKYTYRLQQLDLALALPSKRSDGCENW